MAHIRITAWQITDHITGASMKVPYDKLLDALIALFDQLDVDTATAINDLTELAAKRQPYTHQEDFLQITVNPIRG